MKVIDLLIKISKGEEAPKKIKIKDEIWTYDDYIDYKASDDRGYLFEVHTRINKEDMNEEVEIIEEDKKIEKLVEPLVSEYTYDYAKRVCYKINKIIDYINKGDK